jgi:nucleotide-binding universal stress UspA family protein
MQKYNYKKILIPHDGSVFSSGVIPYIAPLAAACNSEVIVVHILNAVAENYSLVNSANAEFYPSYTPSVTTMESLKTIQDIEKHKVIEEFKHIKLLFKNYNIRKVTTYIEEGLESESIIEFAKAKHCNLIAMSSYGRGGLKRMVLGSVADYIIRNSPCPVLVVHPHLV